MNKLNVFWLDAIAVLKVRDMVILLLLRLLRQVILLVM